MACVQFFERCTNPGELVPSASQILVRPFFHNTSEPPSKRLSTRDSTKKNPRDDLQIAFILQDIHPMHDSFNIFPRNEMASETSYCYKK